MRRAKDRGGLGKAGQAGAELFVARLDDQELADLEILDKVTVDCGSG